MTGSPGSTGTSGSTGSPGSADTSGSTGASGCTCPSACPCGCSPCPGAVSNPPGLSQIAYRATDFSQLRAALLRPLPGEQWLSTWKPAPGDLGLQVLEWWAYLGDILTFYNERIANEDYLGTVTMPANLAGLVDLIGYQPTPGVAATGQVAAVRTTSHPTEPLVVPAGTQLASAATPGVPAQTFQVSGTSTFTGPSQVPVTPYPDPVLTQDAAGTGPASVLLSGKVSGLHVGDQVLLVGQVSGVQLEGQVLDLPGAWQGVIDNWCWTTVAALAGVVDGNTGQTNTLVTFNNSAQWGSAGTSLGTSPQSVLTYQLLRPARSTAMWSRTVPASKAVLSSGACGPVVHLNDVVRAITPGDLVLFDGGGLQKTCLEVVLGTPESTWILPMPTAATSGSGGSSGGSGSGSGSSGSGSGGSGSGSGSGGSGSGGSGSGSGSGSSGSTSAPPSLVHPHTALELFGTDTDEQTVLDYVELETVAVRYGFTPVGTVVAAPTQQIDTLPVTVSAPAVYQPPDTTVTAMLVDTTGTGVLVEVTAGGTAPPVPPPAGTVELTLSAPGTTPVTLDPVLSAPFQLYLDLVPVQRGTPVASEVLGNGDATQINQAFSLQKGPLTYLAEGDTVVPVLTVHVNGTAWTEVPSFYGQAPGATVYVVNLDPSGTATVTFGDGVNGARLPTGSGNVTASYSYGSGSASPPAGRLTTILAPQVNLAAVANPIAVSGGADPQPASAVRQDAPASVFTFGRAVSAEDYQVVAAQAAGVGQAQATWAFDAQAQRATVTVYVAGTAPTGASGLAAAAAAQAALAGASNPDVPVTVLAANPIPLAVAATLLVAPAAVLADVLAAALAALADPVAGPFSPASCPIGTRLYRSRLDAALLVPGVLAVTDLTATNPGWCLTGPFNLGDFLDPGVGAYFALGDTSLVTAVPAPPAGTAGGAA